MIFSILDNDLYKFSMGYAYMKLYPEAEGTFEFHDRNQTVFDQKFLRILGEEFEQMTCSGFMSEGQLDWVKEHIPYIPEFYWDWLHTFRYKLHKISYYLDSEKHLHIAVTDKLYKVTLYEVPILACVSEAYNKWLGNDVFLTNEEEKTKIKANVQEKCEIATSAGFKFSEFGTRRRGSRYVQDVVCDVLKDCSACVGTSNVFFAYKYGMKPIGTMAHEWIMFHGAHYGFKEANYLALEAWTNTYDGNLGIALTDTYTTKTFFDNFSMKQSKLFDGIRQDSGNEFEFVDKTITHYKEMGIDPISKTIVFSNALDFNKAKEITEYCKGKIKYSFGIGTNLTNDFDCVKPMNIVMKLASCRMNQHQTWKPCIKLSDDLGKVMGDETEIKYAKHSLNLF